jgi:hypothetical protein
VRLHFDSYHILQDNETEIALLPHTHSAPLVKNISHDFRSNKCILDVYFTSQSVPCMKFTLLRFSIGIAWDGKGPQSTEDIV